MREYLDARESGQLTDHTSATVGEYLQQWLANQEPTARRTTFRGYQQDLGRVIRCLGHVRLHELTPMQLETTYAEMMKSGSAKGGPLSAKTVYNAHSSLRKALNDGVRLGVPIRNPASSARSPRRTKPEMATWTAAELGEFLDGVEGDPLCAAYVLIATTGMRRGEAMGLRWQDVDLDAGFVRIRQTLTTVNDQLVFDTTKTAKSQRRISLDPSTVAALRSHRARQAEARMLAGEGWDDSNDLAFTQADGTPVHPDRWTRAFQRHVERLGLPVLRGPHSLRHTWATLALEAGVNPKVVSERLGHSTIAITLDTYSHVVEGMDADAATRVADQMRRELRKLLRPNERRLHIRKSDRAQRLRILGALATWELDARVYICRLSRSVGEEEARRLDLERLVADLQASEQATTLFIERRAGADHRDRTTIIRSRRRHPALEFQHLWPTDDPLLWLPDCLAWAVGAGGEWKRLIDPAVEVIEVA